MGGTAGQRAVKRLPLRASKTMQAEWEIHLEGRGEDGGREGVIGGGA